MDHLNTMHVQRTTGRPSDNWSGTKRLPLWMAEGVVRFVSDLNFEALCVVANSIRGRSDCVIDQERFQCGKDHVIFELAFGDGKFWIARFPVKSETGHAIGRQEMESEMATINFVRKH